MKRVVAFLALLAVGLVALKLAIGDDVAVRAETDQARARKRDRAQDAPPGVRVDNGKIQTTVSQSGKLVYPRRREVDVGGGAIRKETVYVLRAEDSRPIGDGLQQLTDVRLELFDDNRHAATVRASRAFLELGRDKNGQPRLEEQKEVDLRDAVVTGEPGGRLEGMRLKLGDAKVNVGEDEIQLTTAANQPVSLRLEGDRPATLTGRGARTRLPRSKDSNLRQLSVTILTDPLLEAADLKVRAAGRLNYVEDLGTGVARVTLDEDVELDLERGAIALPGARAEDAGAGPSRARGNQFLGWLLRSQDQPVAGVEVGANRGRLIWQRLRLVGAPATIDLPGVHVSTPKVTVRPGPLGDPYVVTAHGGASRVEQATLGSARSDSATLVGRSPRRIHLVRPGDSVGALHRAVGFPRWTTRSFEAQQVVVFTGRAELVGGARTLRASDGIVVSRRSDTQSGVVRGEGEIELVQAGAPATAARSARPALVATGSDGLVLTVTDTAERARLGPARSDADPRWRAHRYELRHGDVRVEGRGACDVVRAGDRTDLDLRAPFDEIAARFARQETELRSVRTLAATLVGDQLAAMDVAGLPVQATFARAGERLVARAPRILQTGPRSLRLLPNAVDAPPWNELPEVERTPRLKRTWSAPGAAASSYQVEVRGPRVDLHHAGGRAALVDARGDREQPAQIYAVVPQTGSAEPATVRSTADRLRVLPFVVTPEAAGAHFGGGGAMSGLATRGLSRPWLLVDDVHAFELDDELQGHVEGDAHRLLISQGNAAALFVGDPDELSPAVVRRTHEGRDVELRGARVRVRNEGQIQLSALGAFDGRSARISPAMTLHESGDRGLLSHMSATCRGDIHVDPDAVRFTGPVEAAGLTPAGAFDPDGLRIDARSLVMNRQLQSGLIARVEGQDVHVDWTQLRAQAAKVALDLLRETCVASDPAAAVVTTPDGRELRARDISVNYQTWEVSTGPSSAQRTAPIVDAAAPEGR
ncbi:MAG: hypothetical protein ACON4Z_09145 [Planctomycetota bacterium]